MANSFVNNKQAKLFLAKLIDAAPYLKASKGHFAGSFKGKKLGSNYFLYLNDAGNPTSGLEIQAGEDDSVQEREVLISLRHKKTLVGLDVLESVVDIEDFKNEIAEPYGVRMGAEIQKDAIAETYFDGATAFVSENGWSAMANANAHLRSIRQGAKLVSFIDPMAAANLTIDTLNNWHFGPSQKGQDFYGENSIGKFSGSEYVELTDTPKVTGATIELTITGAAKSDTVEYAADNKTITFDNRNGVKLTVAALEAAIPAGTPLVLEGAKAANVVGMPTNSNFVCFVKKAAKVGDTVLEVGRIELADIGSRNCVIEGASALSDLVGKKLNSILTAGKDYFVVQTRTEDVMEWDEVPLDDLVGAETKSANVGGIGLKVTTLGKFDNMKNSTRWDCAYSNGIVDNRLVSIAYIG